jgi:hypothetical protein
VQRIVFIAGGAGVQKIEVGNVLIKSTIFKYSRFI